MSIREAMTYAQNLFGGEWEYNNTQCVLRARRGQNRGVRVRYGDNLLSYRRSETDDSYTHIMPYWTDGTNYVYTEPEYILVSATSSQMQKKVIPLDLSGQFETAPEPADLLQAAYRSDEYRHPPALEISETVSFISLSQTLEYQYLIDSDHVELGDDVGVKVPILDVEATARCNRIVFDVLRERNKTSTLGTLAQTLAASLKKSTAAANLHIGVYVDISEPTENIKQGDYWIKVDNMTDLNAISVGRYENGEWLLLCKFGSGGGVGEELDVGVHNERFNDYENNTATAGTGYNMPFYSHWEGRNNKIDCTNTTPFPYQPNAIHLEGKNNRFTGNGDSVHVEGSGNTLDGTTENIWSTHVEGDGNTLSGGVGASFIGGYHNIARQISYTFIHGNGNAVTNSSYSFIAGESNTATGAGESLCVGAHNTITVSYSEVFGYGNTCAAGYSIVGGQNNNVTGGFSAVFGHDNNLSNFYQSLAVGYGHTGSGDSTIVSGWYADCSDSYAFVAGNGSDTSPANSFAVTHNGYVTATAYNTTGADYAEYFEWADGNPENEDRRGMLVSLSGDKIQLAHGDDIDGVISTNPSVCGNDYQLNWKGKYKTDVFGEIEYDETGKPVLSDEYDMDREYIPRSQRPEWAKVGLVGQLTVQDNGSCKVGGYVSARNGIGCATFTNTGIRCIKRLDSTHIRVIIK
jgi:hypothetical protein